MTKSDPREDPFRMSLVVVATMLDCQRQGLPAVASVIARALRERGVDARRLFHAMVKAEVITFDGDLLAPGRVFRTLAELVDQLDGKKLKS